MSLKGIFSGRDLLSFYCKKLFIAAWLTPRAGRRAGGRKEGRAAGDGLAWEAASGPTWRGLRGPREGNRGSGPTRSQRVPADADAEAQAPQLTTSLRDPRRRQRRLTASLRAGELAGGARAQAVDRRNRPAAAAAATEGAGTGAGRTRGAPHPGNGCRRSPAPPRRRSTCNGPSGFWRGARKNGDLPLPWAFLGGSCFRKLY